MNRRFLASLFIAIVLVSFPAVAAASATGDLTAANALVLRAMDLTREGKVTEAKSTYAEFTSRWLDIEDGIREQSKTAYRAIEDQMSGVQFSFLQNPPDGGRILAALTALRSANERFINGEFAADGGKRQTGGSVADLLDRLDQAQARIAAQDAAGAAQAVDQFRQAWLNVEGMVLTQSARVYADAERDMVDAYALLTARPPDLAGAATVVDQMRTYLAPIAGKTAYSLVDAAMILLREGLEALLVLVALLAFLKKAGHADKSRWIWAGVGAGLVASVALAVLVKVLIGTGAFGQNNFLIAGWTGVFAAVMLVYVSFWLHSKSSLAEWNRYIHAKSTAALATGSLFSLATLAFLAVFREGTETVLFYIGMASSIAMRDLLLGLGLGALVLIVLAYAMLKLGVRVPLRPFFLVSSLLVFYLGFKFTGQGIHGLQLAGLLPATVAPYLPDVDFLSLYPNWQSTLPQLLLLLLGTGVALWGWRRDQASRRQLAATRG